MDEKLTLNDGTVLPGYCIQDGRNLFIYLYSITLTAAFALLNDPQKTAAITEDQYKDHRVYTGFDHLSAVSEERGGMVSALMIKGED